MDATNEVVIQAAPYIKTQEGVWVPIPQIVVPEDARPHTQADIDSRAVSMARDGQAQAALLSREGDKLVLVYGHGRLLSAKKIHWEKLRCDIKEGLSESQKLMLALAENAERENESPFHTAGVYQKLMETEHLTQEQLAQKLGKGLSQVENYLRLAKIAPEVSQTPNALGVSLRQALAIAKLTKPEDQLKVMEECATQDLAGKALEARVKQLLNPPADGADEPVKPQKEAPLFQFTWKETELLIRARYSAEKPLDGYFEELRTALEEFLTRPHRQDKAASEARLTHQEVPQAA